MSVRTAFIGAAVVLFALLAAGPAVGTPTVPADRAQQPIHRLIQQLGDKDYFVRQRAEVDLAKFGFEAFDALSEATASDDLEIASRARHLLRLMKVTWADKTDPPEVRDLLGNYELQGTDGRLNTMRALLGLPGEAGIPALCRIVRYEKSALLSKQAAVELLIRQKSPQPPSKDRAELVRKSLAGSHRTAALWLLTWCCSTDDPRAISEDWTKLIEAEEATLRTAPTQSNTDIVAALLRFQIARLKSLGRNEEAISAIRRLIQLEKGDPETLSSLLEWLVEQKAWKAVDELAERFSPQIGTNAGLLYALAEAQMVQGDKTRAEQTAERALKLSPGQQPQDFIAHLMAAANLQQRGRFAWAKREFQYVIATSRPGNELTLAAQFRFSEMLHDQGDDQAAAETLQAVEKAAGPKRKTQAQVAGRSLGEVRSRMNYFFACHWEAKADQAKHREFLAKALAADDTDIDVLIASYRLPDQKPEERQKIRRLIDKAAESMREQIADDPDSPSAYNQLAWLVGNTEGDMDEALRCSKKSLELSPDAGGYYDTLAHVYFGKGDYENAVKYQSKAAELDPHSGQIVKKLAMFRKKLEETKKAKP